MFDDRDFWLVLLSLGVTATALGIWINKASDDWLLSTLDYPFDAAPTATLSSTRVNDPTA